MSVLIVEPNEEVALALQVAIERARPGTPVTVCADGTEAAGVVDVAKRTAQPLPRLAILGPHAVAHALAPQVEALRKASGGALPVLALSIDGQARPELFADDVYEQPLDWDLLAHQITAMLDKWLK